MGALLLLCSSELMVDKAGQTKNRMFGRQLFTWLLGLAILLENAVIISIITLL
jgi:hypothetical protein